MIILQELRDEVKDALRHFLYENKKSLSRERKRNIKDILKILSQNNPLEVKQNLLNYLDNLVTGFSYFWPFLEVNRFKKNVKFILDKPKFQEIAILKSMLASMGGSCTQNTISAVSCKNNLLARIENLEHSVQQQMNDMNALQKEICCLKSENSFLTKTISMLSEKNQELFMENRRLVGESQLLAQNAQSHQIKCETLMAENILLKNKLELATSHTIKFFNKDGKQVEKANTIVKTNKNRVNL